MINTKTISASFVWTIVAMALLPVPSFADTAGLIQPFEASTSTLDAISDDGTILAGDYKATSSSDYRAYIWRESTGLVPLGTLGGVYLLC